MANVKTAPRREDRIMMHIVSYQVLAEPMGAVLSGLAGVAPGRLRSDHISGILEKHPDKRSFLKAAKELIDDIYANARNPEKLAKKREMEEAYRHLARILYDGVLPKEDTPHEAVGKARPLDSESTL